MIKSGYKELKSQSIPTEMSGTAKSGAAKSGAVWLFVVRFGVFSCKW